MHGFSLAFSLISALVPLQAGSATAPLAPVVAQAETSPPPQATTPAPSPYAPAPAYSSAPVVSMGGNAPSLKGPTLWGILAYGGYGIGGRFALPVYGSLLHHPTLRDNLTIEFGGDYVHWSEGYIGYDWSWTVIRVAGGVMWDIWVNDQFAFYPKAEIGFNHWTYNYGGFTGTGRSDSPVFINGAAGAMCKTNGGLTLRAEAGYTGLALGVGWFF